MRARDCQVKGLAGKTKQKKKKKNNKKNKNNWYLGSYPNLPDLFSDATVL